MSNGRWVLWQKEKAGKSLWSLRIGRYKNKEAAEDAIASLLGEHPNVNLMPLPEGREPQDNVRARQGGGR